MDNSGFAFQKSIIGLLLIVGALFGVQMALAQDPTASAGKEIFQQKCIACHTVGEGRRVGPDLAGVNERRTENWLLKFIKSSQTVVSSGDPTAKALFDEFKIVMPDNPLSDDQIKQILDHIKETGGVSSTSVPPPVGPTPKPTREEIVRGQDLFQGKLRFASGGPSCISCHNVHYGEALSGGILAKDLTMAFSRLGAPGLRSILASSPFPVMQAAFEGRPLEDGEIQTLIGFLQHVDKENTFHQPREYGWAMFLAGSAGVALLLGFFSVVGRSRKRRSVNQDIYDRQIKSE